MPRKPIEEVTEAEVSQWFQDIDPETVPTDACIQWLAIYLNTLCTTTPASVDRNSIAFKSGQSIR